MGQARVLIQQPAFNITTNGLFEIQDINGNSIFKVEFGDLKTNIREGLIEAEQTPTDNGVLYYDGSAYKTSTDVKIDAGVMSIGNGSTPPQSVKTKIFGIVVFGTEYTGDDQDQQPTGAFSFDAGHIYTKRAAGWRKIETRPLNAPPETNVPNVASGVAGYPDNAGLNAALPNAVEGLGYSVTYSGDFFAVVKTGSGWFVSETYVEAQ